MGTLVAILIGAFIVWLIASRNRAQLAASDCSSLLAKGTMARGILLAVGAQRAARGTSASGYYEIRTVTIDVEIPGREPYECTTSLYVPARLCRLILPGATLELRVDRSSPPKIAVFGPAAGLPSADGPSTGG